MKKIILFFLLIFIACPIIAHAYQGQYPWDPIYIKKVETPTDTLNQQLKLDQLRREQNSSKAISLQNTFGSANYFSCYGQLCASKDLSDPMTEMTCLSSVELCLLSQKNQKVNCPDHSSALNGSCSCDSGYFNRNGVCLSGNEICVLDGGPHKVYAGRVNEETHILECNCETGYAWNEQGTGCIIKAPEVPQKVKGCMASQVLVNNQCLDYCKYHFGDHSYFKWLENPVTIEDTTKFDCFCESGYALNQEKSQCVRTENNTTLSGDAIKKNLPVAQPTTNNPVNNESMAVAVSATTTNATSTEQVKGAERIKIQPEVVVDQKTIQKKSVFKEIREQGLIPWLFRSIRRWFQK